MAAPQDGFATILKPAIIVGVTSLRMIGRKPHLLWPVLFLVTACIVSGPNPADVLLFNGRGTSPNDVAALESLLRERRLSYSTVNSGQLAAMSEAELKAFRLLIVPAGN